MTKVQTQKIQRKPRSRAWFAILLALPLGAAACHGRHRGDMSEAELTERLEDVAEYGLDHVDADEKQTAEVNAVLRGLSPDLLVYRREHHEIAAKLRAELAKDKIDRSELESIRQEGLDLADRASARASQALADAAEKLTVEQRRKLTAQWEKHRH